MNPLRRLRELVDSQLLGRQPTVDCNYVQAPASPAEIERVLVNCRRLAREYVWAKENHRQSTTRDVADHTQARLVAAEQALATGRADLERVIASPAYREREQGWGADEPSLGIG